jgi:hypothetical protein
MQSLQFARLNFGGEQAAIFDDDALCVAALPAREVAYRAAT